MLKIEFTKRKKLLVRILLLISLTAITFLSLFPDPPDPGLDIPFFDKIEHVIAYIALGGLALISFRKQRFDFRINISAVLFCTLYGIIIEILQTYTGRMREFADIVADFSGAFIGVIIFEIAALIFLTGTEN